MARTSVLPPVLLSSVLAVVGCAAESERAPPCAPRAGDCRTVEACAEAVAQEPTDARLRILWGRRLEDTGRAAAAAKEFRAAIRLAVDDPVPVDAAASGLVRLGDAEGCVALLDAAISQTHPDGHARARLARARAICADAASKPDG